MAARDYSPLEIGELAGSVVNALLRQEQSPVPPTVEFLGCGLYAIYYHGDHPEYRAISDRNRESPASWPIYVGKAVPSGGRKGWAAEGDTPKGPFLFRRLRQHAESIEQLAITLPAPAVRHSAARRGMNCTRVGRGLRACLPPRKGRRPSFRP